MLPLLIIFSCPVDIVGHNDEPSTYASAGDNWDRDATMNQDRARSRSPDARDARNSPSNDRRSDRRDDRRDDRPSRGNFQDRAVASQHAAHEASRKSQKNCRVYVGNLSYGVKWNTLKDFMREGG